MKYICLTYFCFWIAFATQAQPTQLTDYVNPLMGTDSEFSLSNGNTYPAIARPWGMNFWSPQTAPNGDGWMYAYDANKIRGIKQTHQPSPWLNDYAAFSLFAITGTPVFDEEKRASWFSHKAETAKPHYYQVYLADYNANVEVTTTERAAFFRFSYDRSPRHLKIPDGSGLSAGGDKDSDNMHRDKIN